MAVPCCALQLRRADVYEGMVIGEHNREEDLDVNVAKEKKASNVRTVQASARSRAGLLAAQAVWTGLLGGSGCEQRA
jgi:predicted membrane GTPase involved in stress response